MSPIEPHALGVSIPTRRVKGDVDDSGSSGVCGAPPPGRCQTFTNVDRCGFGAPTAARRSRRRSLRQLRQNGSADKARSRLPAWRSSGGARRGGRVGWRIRPRVCSAARVGAGRRGGDVPELNTNRGQRADRGARRRPLGRRIGVCTSTMRVHRAYRVASL